MASKTRRIDVEKTLGDDLFFHLHRLGSLVWLLASVKARERGDTVARDAHLLRFVRSKSWSTFFRDDNLEAGLFTYFSISHDTLPYCVRGYESELALGMKTLLKHRLTSAELVPVVRSLFTPIKSVRPFNDADLSTIFEAIAMQDTRRLWNAAEIAFGVHRNAFIERRREIADEDEWAVHLSHFVEAATAVAVLHGMSYAEAHVLSASVFDVANEVRTLNDFTSMLMNEDEKLAHWWMLHSSNSFVNFR